MKLKYTFKTVRMADQVMAVPVNGDGETSGTMLRLNETAAFILEQLKEDTTEDKIYAAVRTEYEGDEAEIRAYIHKYPEELDKSGLLQ